MADTVDLLGADSIKNMKVADLKKELKARGLSTTGNKSELVERLEAAAGVPKDLLTDVQLDDASLDPTAEVNEDEVLSEDSLLLQTEGKANNGEAFGSDEDLLATPVSKTAPQQITDKLPLTATDLSVSAKGQEKAAGQPAKQALSQEPKTPDAGKKSKTKVTMSGQAGAETNGTGGAIKAAGKALSVEERAKKFNMPLSDSARLKVRMERFGAVASDSGTAKSEAKGTTKTSRTSISANPPPVNLVQLKKRAERFGQSVSTVAKDLEEKERLLKRKQRFGNTPDTEGTKKSKTIVI
ncbi:SAP domain-containing ribonucleoprotein [Ixodes scapularis]|uniref:SAP domain-containing ribonucleoprotein n=1 Tax=Ixodes scapularis TaxID=6945 RepID=UPI001A9EC82B|nr:SAP domain-containing ribonucleoprotein [Ixodes scapularis]